MTAPGRLLKLKAGNSCRRRDLSHSGAATSKGGSIIVLQQSVRLGRFRILLFVSAVGILFALGLSSCRKPALTSQQAEGKQLYDVRCAHCHQDNDLQLKKVPPDLHGVFSRSTLPSGAPATDVQVARTVLAGRNMMPAFAGRFTTGQMEALLAYLHTNLKDDAAQ